MAATSFFVAFVGAVVSLEGLTTSSGVGLKVAGAVVLGVFFFGPVTDFVEAAGAFFGLASEDAKAAAFFSYFVLSV